MIGCNENVVVMNPGVFPGDFWVAEMYILLAKHREKIILRKKTIIRSFISLN